MKFLLATGLFSLMSVAAAGQTCAVSVIAQGVVVGSGQTAAVRTANTANLNNMFASIGSGGIPCHNVQFPEGTIEINGAISVSLGPISIYGVNRELSIIMQTAAAAPVFLWNSNNKYTTGISVHDLGFDNTNTTAPYNSSQWGLQLQCTANGRGGNGWGYANNQFQRLSISHMNVGFGERTTRDGVCGIWSTHFEDIKFYNMQRNAFYLVSSGATGQPANQFDRIDVLQENTPPTTTGAAIYIVGAGGLLMNSINIEGWHNLELEIYGGNSTVINNLRVEHAVFTSTPDCNPSIAFLDGDVVMNGTNISWDVLKNSCQASVFSLAGSTTNLTVNGLTLVSTVGPPPQPVTLWWVQKPTPPAKIFANSLNLGGIVSEYVPSTNSFKSTLYSRYTIDHLPPPVDRLPTADATYLGRSFRVVAATSNIVYQCIRNSSGAYVWVSQ